MSDCLNCNKLTNQIASLESIKNSLSEQLKTVKGDFNEVNKTKTTLELELKSQSAKAFFQKEGGRLEHFGKFNSANPDFATLKKRDIAETKELFANFFEKPPELKVGGEVEQTGKAVEAVGYGNAERITINDLKEN